ncbi:MAG TPA: glutamine-hydrolyzing carbamoyl-phosphate synthase small subunit [Candidatus Merdivicinus intestinavium]|nr:glutamine-hydrolyzing carbamoyl-phosphate synthase small subunit [Candidatus Merdivicinus intestinavium]
MEESIYLVLEDGTVFEGKPFGAAGEVTGEVVFTTGMVGYLETLTDPSYYGQIVVQTFPLIGNYGVIPADFESRRPALSAYIVREWCEEPSNFRCEGTLDAYLKQNGVVGLSGIDTRALTRIIREHGVMNGKIIRSLEDREKAADEAKRYRIVGAVEAVSTEQPEIETPENQTCRVVLWDFGEKENIRRELLKRGCEVVRMPAGSSAEEILGVNPDGIMLSNGPGDPSENTAIVEELKKVLASGLPVFGICLGHQLTALAMGGRTEKLKYGHRGGNQPVTDKKTGRVYITSQNHGYAVAADSLPENAFVRFVNANDGTCEGVDYEGTPVFTVQFHPEACSGPQDTNFLFDWFLHNIRNHPSSRP